MIILNIESIKEIYYILRRLLIYIIVKKCLYAFYEFYKCVGVYFKKNNAYFMRES